jgi:hypothetical protein
LDPAARVATDHDLNRADPTGLFVVRGGSANERTMQVGQEADRQRAAFPLPREGVFGHPHVVQHLTHRGIGRVVVLVRGKNRLNLIFNLCAACVR